MTSAPTPATAPGGTAPSGVAGMARRSDEEPDVFDPSLMPSIIPWIASIVDSLSEASRDSSSLFVARGNGDVTNGDPNGARAPRAACDSASTALASGPSHSADPSILRPSVPAPQDRSDGPSIALGQVSDDDTSLYDFLFSSSATGSGGGLLGSSSGGQPSELSVRILREARELRDVYRAAEKAIAGVWRR
ncbi:hypothetical protein BCV69DRAFT_157068 [Microstroma glucosiphilum]|uniref:Uncharacterized protein n=1 Tax=Pseudomicrostroma glucosiphilum TaxID=1684307 RepID=A0A316UAI5_9BASI|nr:hypothetical protein BCV69DRAFT_157068 [Pseudomicrostroma glucosiphilum]PWN21844.1 hypothetical protein BCV69DRAFT_157068 [Pseudomicrostroma glucosiphilum]